MAEIVLASSVDNKDTSLETVHRGSNETILQTLSTSIKIITNIIKTQEKNLLRMQ
jgi:hypothetical protein